MKENNCIYKKPQFCIKDCVSFIVGHDTNWDNASESLGPLFGLGNTILVIDKHQKVYFIQDKVEKLKNIQGTITGFISPIGNNDCPYPMLFTTTHMMLGVVVL